MSAANTLDAREIDEVLRVIDAAVSDLSMEIADTDNATFRAGLRARRDLLVGVSAKLRSPA